MEERRADRVTAPDVVGLPFHVGRDIAAEFGVALASPYPDGPPISGLAWPGLFYITSQNPSPGTELYRDDSVIVEIVDHGGAENRALRNPSVIPPVDVTHATTTDAGDLVDLTRDLMSD
ncbi:PASTA domain-containing protein [Rhodoglobus sp.]